MEFTEIINQIIVLLVILVGGMLLVAIIIIFFKEGLIDVKPKRAVVVRNIWTSEAMAFMKTGYMIPGIHKKLMEITLENEPSSSPTINVLTQDGAEIGIKLVITTQQVIPHPDSVIKAATEINYEKRTEAILNRIKVYLQHALICCTLESIVKGEQGVFESTRNYLKTKLPDLSAEWGFKVEASICNIELPEKAKAATERYATARQEGRAAKAKADAAGINPLITVIGNTISDVLRTSKK